MPGNLGLRLRSTTQHNTNDPKWVVGVDHDHWYSEPSSSSFCVFPKACRWRKNLNRSHEKAVVEFADMKRLQRDRPTLQTAGTSSPSGVRTCIDPTRMGELTECLDSLGSLKPAHCQRHVLRAGCHEAKPDSVTVTLTQPPSS